MYTTSVHRAPLPIIRIEARDAPCLRNRVVGDVEKPGAPPPQPHLRCESTYAVPAKTKCAALHLCPACRFILAHVSAGNDSSGRSTAWLQGATHHSLWVSEAVVQWRGGERRAKPGNRPRRPRLASPRPRSDPAGRGFRQSGAHASWHTRARPHTSPAGRTSARGAGAAGISCVFGRSRSGPSRPSRAACSLR